MLFSHKTEMSHALPISLPTNEPYLLLPESLALDLRDSPLAVGIYLLIGRIFLIHRGPISLSAKDISNYDGSDNLQRDAIIRALTRLYTKGYLLPHSKNGRGVKATYLPGWGGVKDEARPWSFDAECLDRPRSVRTVRVPRMLIDVCMGRITPHQRHPAIIDRYVTRPPISLRDLGSYGLSWAGIPTPTPTLIRLGLVNASGPVAPPTYETLLARISQQPLFDSNAPTLSLRGLQRAGFNIAPATPAPESPMLFFIPTNMIGYMSPPMRSQMIGGMIGSSNATEAAFSSSESAESPNLNSAKTATGTPGISGSEATPSAAPPISASAKTERISRSPSDAAKDQPDDTLKASAATLPKIIPPAADAATTPAPISVSDAAKDQPVDTLKADAATLPKIIPPAADAAATPAPASATPSEEVLRELGVYPSVARKHRELSLELIERAHTIARRLPGRRSVAATIVQLLREEQASPGWLRNGRPDLFLRPMDEDDLAADREEYLLDVDEADPRTRVHALLRDTLSQDLSSFIERQDIALDADQQVVVRVPSWFSSAERTEVGAVLPVVAAQIGLRVIMPAKEVPTPVPPAPALIRVPAAPPAPKNERPDWISPEQWSQLHLIARSAFSGSHWVDGEIVGSGPGTTRLLRGSLANLVARLQVRCLESASSGGVASHQGVDDTPFSADEALTSAQVAGRDTMHHTPLTGCG